MNKLTMFSICTLINVSACVLHYRDINLIDFHEYCSTKEGKYFCKYSYSCIDITDECKPLSTSYNYINGLFW